MQGVAECLFVGAPGGEKVLNVPGILCRVRLSIEQDGWIAAGADGGTLAMQGQRPPNANWECFTRAVYEKDLQSKSTYVTYRFLHLETVSRCAQILAQKNRRCKHEALPTQLYCRQHQSQSGPST